MAEKTELRQRVIGIGFEDDLIVKSQRGRTYSVKLAEDLEIDTDTLFNKDPEESVWATIDTGANPWVVLDVEITS